MKKTTLVAALLLLHASTSFATSTTSDINEIESEWAKTYYTHDKSIQEDAYPKLIVKTNNLLKLYPKSVELKIWKAILISTNAEFENPYSALESIRAAKNILEVAIQEQPNALDGAAFVVLGTLYYMTPSWPISFGDKNKAENLLKKGIEINPDSIDANYFYADYLLSKDKTKLAEKYFKLALKKPIRPEQKYADNQLKKEATIALNQTKHKITTEGKNRFWSQFTSARTD